MAKSFSQLASYIGESSRKFQIKAKAFEGRRMGGGVLRAFTLKRRSKRRFNVDSKTAAGFAIRFAFDFEGKIGAPGTIRTSDPQIRRGAPVEQTATT
jgi:hypothetical protein